MRGCAPSWLLSSPSLDGSLRGARATRPPQRTRRRPIWLVVMLAAATVAAHTSVFGPQRYSGTGRPELARKTFNVQDATGELTLRVVNRGITSAMVILNGRIVLRPSDVEPPRRLGYRGWDDPRDRDGRDRDGDRRDGNDEHRGRDDRDRWEPEWDRFKRDHQYRGDGQDRDRDWRGIGGDDHDVRPLIERTVSLRRGTNEIIVGYVGRRGTSLTIEILRLDQPVGDTTPPVVTSSLTPPPNANGWHNGPATVTFTCSDAGSGVRSCPAAVTVTAEGANHLVSGTAVDAAGNTASASATVNIDRTPPRVTASQAPVANAEGWHRSPVLVTFVADDALSGIAPGSLTAPVTLGTDGANQSAQGQAIDLAGNVGSTQLAGIHIDQSPPWLSVTLVPEPSDTGFSNGPVTGRFTCSDTGSGIVACPSDRIVTSEGANQTVTGTVVDRAGNRATATSGPFGIDVSPPVVTVAVSPPPNAAGWNNSTVTVRFACSDPGAGVVFCPPDHVVATEGATQLVTGTATDAAGHQTSASVSVNLDVTAPVFVLTSPTNGTTLYTRTATLVGTATDVLSGVSAVTCGSLPTAPGGGVVACEVPLVSGPNAIPVTVADTAGNSGTSTVAVSHTRVPGVTITSPANLSHLNITPTTVTGTVDDPSATVTINGIPAVVASGRFSAAIPVGEGPTIITASATTAAGGAGTASIEVTLDTTPPRVTVTSPPDQFVTTDTSISVAGIVNDIVVGTVNAEQAQVTVNGVAAQVANRHFLVSDVALAMGPNVIQVVGRDRTGNAGTTQVTVTRQVVTRAQITLIGGNNQTAPIGSHVSAPLAVALTDATGRPVPNKPVVFKVTQNDGLVTGSGAPAPTVAAMTDAQGQAHAQWKLGMRAGAGGNAVEAYAIGFEGTAIFAASGTQGPAGQIVVDTGTDQVGAIGQPLPKPFIAVVVDEGNNRLGGVPVTFTVSEGGGGFAGEPSVTVVSDPDGRVAATLTLGLQEGHANNLVSASFPTNQGFPAVFAASGRAPGDPAKTTITGVVLDNSNRPIAGVSVRAVTNDQLIAGPAQVNQIPAVQTDAQGQFTIAPAPVGFVDLLLDGSTAAPLGTYPSLEYEMVTVAGQNNTVGLPIYLLPIQTANQLCVIGSTGGGTLTILEAPGFSLTFGPGQVTFPGGAKDGCVTVTVVNREKIPMVPGFGQQPRFIVTIQPSGAVFNPPAAITLPNVDGLQARSVTEMYSFDHDIGAFVAIGTGTVSEDGQVIRSNPGVGVLKAGWHCGGNPQALGTAAACGDCNRCVPTLAHPEGECVVDASNPPPFDSGDCVNKACDINGNVVVTSNDSEIPSGPAPVCNARVCFNGEPVVVPDDSNTPQAKCAFCSNGEVVPPRTREHCCAVGAENDPVVGAGGYVVCCNGEQLACVNTVYSGVSSLAADQLRKCALRHQVARMDHTAPCPTGANECRTTGPLSIRPDLVGGIARAECEAYTAEAYCLLAVECGVDDTCRFLVRERMLFILDELPRPECPSLPR